jgi:ribonuclease R
MYVFDKNQYSDSQRLKLANSLENICKHINSVEIISQRVESEVNEMKYAEYMEKKINEKFKGVITHITSYGIFIMLENLITGLIKLKELKNDFYVFNQETNELIGKNTKFKYMVGMYVDVTVIAASKKDRKIEFKII